MVSLHFLRTFFIYFSCIFSTGVLKPDSSKKTKRLIAKETLLNKISFRLNDKAKSDILIGLRIFKRTLVSIWSNNVPVLRNANILGIISNESHKQELLKYSVQLEKENSIEMISKSEILFADGPVDKLLVTIFVFSLAIPIIPFCFISSNRDKIGLLLTQITETSSLAFLIKRYQFEKVYDFLPYENDSNINTLLLNSYSIKVYKFPSTGPLQGHNQYLIADTLILSSRYHLDELKYFKNTILVKNHIPYIPEFGYKYIQLYLKNDHNTSLRSLGYYSSASWLRKASGASSATVEGSMDEIELLNILRDFLSETREEYSLKIFLHPKEKSNLKLSKHYYSNLFKEIPHQVSYEKVSSKCFNDVDVGIGVYSTILFERLFCGFKTILFPKNIKNFPLQESSLYNVAPKSKSELINLITTSSQLTTKDFFEAYQLEEYRFYGYQY